MADPLTREQRRRVMQSNRGKDTKLELAVRRGLYARGLRYRLHGPRSIGSPDIMLKGRHAVVYVHGCFWHQHPGCKNAPKVKHGKDPEWWAKKFRDNIARDRRNMEKAREAGYRVAVVWECVIEQKKTTSAKRERALDRLAEWLRYNSTEDFLEIG